MQGKEIYDTSNLLSVRHCLLQGKIKITGKKFKRKCQLLRLANVCYIKCKKFWSVGNSSASV